MSRAAGKCLKPQGIVNVLVILRDVEDLAGHLEGFGEAETFILTRKESQGL